jgi:hypothetical protein
VPRDIIVAFDDIVHGTSNVYSSSFVDLALGELESLALQVVAEPLTTPSDNITVQIETSADGRNWVSKNSSAEVFLLTPGATTSSTVAFDPGLRPSLGLVRLRVQLGGSSTCGAKIIIYVREGPNPGFLPPRLPGCRLWLRSDLGVTLVGAGTNVGGWADQSGNGNDASQATTINQPLFVQSSVGLPKISVASGNFMLGNFANSISTHTAFAVLSYPAAPASNHAAFAGTDASNNANSGFSQFTETTTGIVARAGASPASFTSATTVDGTSLGAIGIYSTAAQSNTAVDLFVNGRQKASVATALTLFACPKYVLFALDGAASYPFVGDAYEFIVYDSVLSVADRQLVHGYLGSRYGVVLQ